MSILKYIGRLKQMDSLLRRKATGTPEQFAKKLGISKSTLFYNLNELKELGGEIVYCKYRETYYYKMGCELHISFSNSTLSENDTNKIIGGINRKYRRISPTPIIQDCRVLYLKRHFINAC